MSKEVIREVHTAALKARTDDILTRLDRAVSLGVTDEQADELEADAHLLRKDAVEQARNARLRDEIEALRGPASYDPMMGHKSGPGFGAAVASAGFNLKTCPSVTVVLRTALEKAPTPPAVGDWNRAAPVLVPMGRDERFLNSNLVPQNVSGETAIQDFRQTARTLTGSTWQRRGRAGAARESR